ncbi:hypothetical protein PHLGIDRAFT_67051 [Phlebiopsis gigantea 11061_1 CR5-6]|uniref:Mitochondrial K+-H+ exchange-related-domain-containing protein n=1 Tax=Phlebiopsis gigantea (strain 11061_1 CR5-6) TaxID=745531 RepID=A0A0C3PR96_PHLG1|nr:hypothetical protein PHLGIDRAFT_67051 [Phlebiopsis gigantea 11061_1 CR5-6]
MSVVPSLAKRTLRIVALPLVSASKTPAASSSAGQLTYYHFFTPPPKDEHKKDWVKWATNKAGDLWAGFGKAPEGHWKRRTFLYGERLVDRIDFEELALKSLDPSLGPNLTRFGHSESNVESEKTPQIPLIYPSSVCSSPIEHLRSLVRKRGPRHKKGCYMWLLISPLTAPFMIIPVIPNLPFFFCIWRSWSHWKAYRASTYLEQLLAKGAIVPEESKELNQIYLQYANTSTSPTPASTETKSQHLDSDASTSTTANQTPQDSKGPAVHRRLLLTRDAVPELTTTLDLPPDSAFASDVYRALEQAALRLQKAEPDLKP